MSRVRTRALVLSAGFGTRLRPLTFLVPKPLLPVAGEPVAGVTLRQLQAAGCEAAALNLHHLAEAVPRFFGSSYFGLPLHYSHEEQIQGTYGALHPLREFLRQGDAALVVNGDSLCRWPIRQALRRHVKRGADLTLLLLRRAPDAALGGGIGVDGEGRVTQFRDLPPAPGRSVLRRHVFAGLHILSPRLLDRLEPRSGDIISELYQPLLQEGAHIAAYVTGRRWHDLGTPTRYHAAALEAARFLVPLGRHRREHLSPLADIDPAAEVKRCQIERGVRIEANVRLESSIVMEGAHLGAGCRVRHSIVGPGVVLPQASDLEQRMINPYDKRHELGDQESQMGDLVYTPL